MEKKENKEKIRGMLRSSLRWPLYLIPLLLAMNVAVYVIDRRAGAAMAAFMAVYIVISLCAFAYCRSRISADLARYAVDFSKAQRQLLKEMVIPYGMLDEEGRLLWGNDELLGILSDEKAAKRSIFNVIPDLTPASLPKTEQDEEVPVTLEDRCYRVILRRMVMDDEEGRKDGRKKGKARNRKKYASGQVIIGIYLYDETETQEYIRENREQKLVVGLLNIDNYDEVMEGIDDVRQSLLMALVDRKVNKYMREIDAIFRKMEKDKYFFVFQQKYLPTLQGDRFSILEDIKSVSIGNGMSVTISIGLGVGGSTYAQSHDYARAAIDLALGRGGDQAVVKEDEKIYYYDNGGKNVQMGKTTRVKARVKAHALKELVEAKEKVVVMGHSLGDVDSFGASIGIYRIAKTLGKRAYIVINDVTTSVRPIMDRFLASQEYEEDMFIKGEKAVGMVDRNTLLVIVDVNRPSYTECEELIHLTNTVVILDHHRRTDDVIEHAVLSYIEPFASSACEMVTEILQYIGEDLKIRQVEADAMYSGIMIDTDNFLTKTGVRTFEAAAYLRRHGADVTRIRKGFRSDMGEYKIRAEAIQHTEIYLDSYAITVCNAQGVDSPTILGAQVANELLDIQGVKASFVLTEFKEKIYVSARSIDELNVQLVMEKLGGGGHMSVAGAQLSGCTVEEGKERVREVLRSMREEGEI